MRTAYPSDITRKQFEVIRSTLESAKKVTHPRETDIYDIFCAILYRKREGCRWRSLPHDFPKWQNCYYHYNEWRKADENKESVLDRVMRELVENERIIHGRESTKTTMIIVDSKSIKNTDTAEEKGFDAGKNIRRKIAYCGRYSRLTSRNVRDHRKCNRQRRRIIHDWLCRTESIKMLKSLG